VSAPHDTGDVIPLTPRPTMPLAEAKQVLASIGYRPDWTNEQLLAATPYDMRQRVQTALRVMASAYLAEARELEAEMRRRWPDDR
jgi:hypothetical protein